jgi:preprotein translocase subunit SecG
LHSDAAFGGGSQQSLLGTTGSAPILTKVTVGLVAIFFITSLSLAYFNRHFGSDEAVIIPTAETVSDAEANASANQEDMAAPQVTVNPVNDDLPVAPNSESTAEENTSDIPVPE